MLMSSLVIIGQVDVLITKIALTITLASDVKFWVMPLKEIRMEYFFRNLKNLVKKAFGNSCKIVVNFPKHNESTLFDTFQEYLN